MVLNISALELAWQFSYRFLEKYSLLYIVDTSGCVLKERQRAEANNEAAILSALTDEIPSPNPLIATNRSAHQHIQWSSETPHTHIRDVQTFPQTHTNNSQSQP
jgi:hypothetical protein